MFLTVFMFVFKELSVNLKLPKLLHLKLHGKFWFFSFFPMGWDGFLAQFPFYAL